MKSKNNLIIILIWIPVVFWGLSLITKTMFSLLPYPELDDYINKAYSTRFYDTNDELIYVNPLEDGLRREFTPIEKIPKNVQKIFINAEDKRFYYHSGVDYTAILNGFFQNKNAGKTVRGASTIPMQLVKMITGDSSPSLGRKIGNVFNAWRIEAKLSKQQILELYLNSVPFGHSCEGVTSAARLFYGKELKNLTDYEIACLSVIPRRPSLYDPTVNPAENAEKAEIIFSKVFHTKKSELEQVKKDLLSAAESASLEKAKFYMPHYINYLKNQLTADGNKLPYEYKTSTNLKIYFEAESLLKSALMQSKDSRITNASLLLINNKDNSVVTWIGNYDWFDSYNNGQIDGVLVKNQPGSSMKPFLYALGLETKNSNGFSKITPYTIFADIPKEFGSENLYIPSNFDNRYNGPIRMRIALASSLNVPAVDLLNTLGVDNYLQKLFELGFDSLRKNGRDADLGLALGAGEVTLYELVNAFSVFPKKGIGPDGNRVYSEDTAALICSILSDKSARALGFGYSQSFETKYPSIFKTGTSNQYQNIVALGATPEFTIGVWMGNFKGQTVRGKTGSSLPAWVARNLLDKLTIRNSGDGAYSTFDLPEHWHYEKICPLSGMKASANCPSYIKEYAEDGVQLEKCNWHVKKGDDVQIIYPSEYQSWSRLNMEMSSFNYSSSPLTILTPKNGSKFYYSMKNKDFQAISSQVIGGLNDTLNVYYDGHLYQKVSRPFKFMLPVEVGEHEIVVECGEEKQSCTFVVE